MWGFEYVIMNPAKQNPLCYADSEHRWYACHGDQNMSLAEKLNETVSQLSVEEKHNFTWNLSCPHWRGPQSQRKSRNYTLGAKIQPVLSLDFGWHDECGFLERVILIPSFISDWHWRMCLHNSQYVSDSECRDFIPKDFILICCCSSGFEASHKSLPTVFFYKLRLERYLLYLHIYFKELNDGAVCHWNFITVSIFCLFNVQINNY